MNEYLALLFMFIGICGTFAGGAHEGEHRDGWGFAIFLVAFGFILIALYHLTGTPQ